MHKDVCTNADKMALIVKLLHPDAVLPEMGKLRSCEDVLVGPQPTTVRTGVSVFVPHGMYAAAFACNDSRAGCEVVTDEEVVVVLSAGAMIRKGDHIADLVFGFRTTVAEGPAAEMGPLA